MFGTLARVLGFVSVRETGGIVEVTGVPAEVIARHIAKVYSTKRITTNMFTRIWRSGFAFPSFFAVEVHYMLKEARLDAKTWSMKHSLDRIIEGLEEKTWLKSTMGPVKSMVDLSLLKNLKWKAKPHQIEFLKTYGDMVPRYHLRGYYLGSAPGTGKSLRDGTKVKTPTGWTEIQDLKVGDMVVAWDGSPTQVLGVYPQGKRQNHRVIFEDDRSLDVCIDHLWGTDSGVKSTGDILSDLSSGGSVSVPVFSPDTNESRYLEMLFSGGCAWDPVTEMRYVDFSDIDLARYVQKDIWSIGGIAHYECIGDATHRVRFLTRGSDEITHLGIKSVDVLDDFVDMTCIAVDHPDKLFVVEDYIVTHNTFMDLALAATVIPRDIAEVKIIISPLNAIHTVWQETVVELFHKAPNYWMSSTPGPAPVDRKTEYFIFHYESLNRAVMLCRQFAARGVKFFVIIDESHNFNEITSNRTIELVSLLSKLQYKPFNVWASGSPFKAMGKEAIPFLRSNDPLFTPDVEARFKKIFGGDNLKAMDILGHRLGLITFKTSKDTVMSGEKPLIYRRMVKASEEEARPFLIETIREEMRDFIVERVRYYQSQLDTYTDLFNSLVELHRKSLPNTRIALDRYKRYVWVIGELRKAQARGKRPPVEYLQETKAYETTYLIPSLPAGARKQFRKCQSVVKSLKLKVRGEAMGRILIPRRAQCAAFLGRECRLPEIIKESESKTLVFSSAVSVILNTAEYLKGEGFLPEVVYQKTNKFLTEIIKRFRDDPNVNPVCATFQSLSTAVPMTMASTLVMLNLPFRQYIYDQTISRVYRLGQPYQVRIFEVLLDTGDRPNVSTRAMDIIAWCREQLDVLLGGEFSGPEDDDIIFEKILKTT